MTQELLPVASDTKEKEPGQTNFKLNTKLTQL
jgi:hypothetical protein